MTLEETIGQLNQVSATTFLNPPNREEMIQKGEIGSFLWSVDPVQLDKYQHIAVEKSRLHIPLLFGYEVILGFRAVFPVPIALAASWDPQVPERAQAFAARVYVTMDTRESRATEYEELDRECAGMTAREKHFGEYEA
jgi:beta-glucosidase